MYQYSEKDKTLLLERAKQFRGQVEAYLSGGLDEEEFKQLRLRNGLYLQRHAPMLRVAIPYGLLSSAQLRTLASVAERFDRGYGHFTTRQNIQFNWPKLDQVPDILDDLAAVDMHAIQTSGNVVRNITTDAFAGVAADEQVNPLPYCEAIRQLTTFHPEFNWLPRKFKIAITGSTDDRSAMLFHDIGLRFFIHEGYQVRVQVYVGGGQGRTPVIGKLLEPACAVADLPALLQSILRVYNLYGRRDNLYKARIKILVNALGIDAFREQVMQHFELLRQRGFRLQPEWLKEIRQRFAPFSYESNLPELSDSPSVQAQSWLSHNALKHRVQGYTIVVICLKSSDCPPGDLSAEHMRKLADLADRYSSSALRVMYTQNLVLPYVRQCDAVKLYHELEALGLTEGRYNSADDVICCPGLDYCSLANATTIGISNEIQRKLAARRDAIGNLRVNISGCMNACGHHNIGEVGVLGVEKQGKEFYQITVGGEAGGAGAIGKRIGPAVDRATVAQSVDQVVEVYEQLRQQGESMADTVRRVGVEPFKHRVYS